MRHRILLVLALLAVAGTAFASGEGEEEHFTTLGIDAISVKTEFLDVEIRAEDRLGVSMSSDLPETSLFGPRRSRVMHEMSGSRLNVWVEKGTAFYGRGRGKLVFRVPRDMRVRVETVSGDILFDKFEGRISARTVSGAITGWDVAVTGDLSFSTISGNVELRLETTIDDLRFDLSSISGRIVVGNVRAERGLRMGFGRTSIRGHTVSGSLIFRER